MYREKLFRMKSISESLPSGLSLQFHTCGRSCPTRPVEVERPDSDVFCIAYVADGRGSVRAGDAEYTPHAGDALLLPEGVRHLCTPDRKQPWEVLWINLSGDFARQLIRLHGLEGAVHFPSLDLSELLGRFLFCAEGAPEDAARTCVALLEEILYRMAESHEAPRREDLSPVEQILHYIEQHETEAIRLEQLAEACGKSPSQAERIFSREMGMPIYRYVLSRKLDLACRLLIETGMSVRDIAAYLSFDDEFYFSGLFRRKIGTSPSQYRKTGGKLPEEKPKPRRRREDDIVLL